MCGIVAYIGKKEAYPVLIKGLKRLEYRGYDSAGIALLNGDEIAVYKRQGKVANLEEYAADKLKTATSGIGHTRWATHGPPNDVNAHPHSSEDGSIALIHNGIIENYNVLKEELITRGYTFKSQTDTEVLVHLISDIKKKENVALDEAVRLALLSVIGAYAIVV
ncbi:MAG: glutamine--fructose-6-phosphate aminotransferase, partial [Fluviicola sp.]